MFEQYSIVKLTTGRFGSIGLKTGDVCEIIDKYSDGEFELEFSDVEGTGLAFFSAKSDDFEKYVPHSGEAEYLSALRRGDGSVIDVEDVRMLRLSAHAATELSATAYGTSLDFSVESVLLLDGLIRQIMSTTDDALIVSRRVFSVGCYLGEVIVREALGDWRSTGDTLLNGHSNSPFVIDLFETQNLCDPIGRAVRASRDSDLTISGFYDRIVKYHS